jgi:hypothetical protein
MCKTGNRDMPRRRRRANFGLLGCAAAIVLSAMVPAHAEAIHPNQIDYNAGVSEDPAAKACMLQLLLKGNDAGETVKFALIVARMKREDAVAGPLVFGFSIEVRGPRFADGRLSASRPVEISSAAFVSDRYTATARPRTAPLADGSWVGSTLDPAEGSELVEVATNGNFLIAYTRERPAAARIYNVISAPPLDVLWRFGGCIDALDPTG